jgi:squalene-associated FAD-dependent desaturase
LARPLKAVSTGTSGGRWAVIGGGWAGLAAAIEATRLGHTVTLYELAGQLGGRARSLTPEADGTRLDNGQHILIGAYRATLGLMTQIGLSPADLLLRQPLALLDPAGRGLQLPAGAPLPAFVRGVLGLREWPLSDRMKLLRTAARWGVGGFRCAPTLSVAQLSQGLGARVQHDLIDPLCVAALNTPAAEASAAVFLRVLRDALFSGRGSADLLLPRRPLADLLPEPAKQWLSDHGADVHLGTRVDQLRRQGTGWQVNEEPYDRVVLASSAAEAARLAAPYAPDWARTAQGLRYEPIVTVYLHSPGATLSSAMTALAVDAPGREPAQFAFDQGRIAGPAQAGRFAFVVSGATEWVSRGTAATEAAVRAQAHAALRPPAGVPKAAVEVLRSVAEKRATFRCTPGVQRPGARVAPGLVAAGDYVAGPYPASLEGAVRSGLAAVKTLSRRDSNTA